VKDDAAQYFLAGEYGADPAIVPAHGPRPAAEPSVQPSTAIRMIDRLVAVDMVAGTLGTSSSTSISTPRNVGFVHGSIGRPQLGLF
jgi:hypothetical protein